MKKYLILLLFVFLLSCSASVPEKTDISTLNRQCGNKAPFSSYVSSEKIYWSFFNDADKQCYYLGFLWTNFFLISNGDPYSDNLLWSPFGWYDNFIEHFQKQYIHSFQETPAFHNYYDIFDLYEKTFTQYNLSLPEPSTVPVFQSENIEEMYKNSIYPILEKTKNSEKYYENPIFSPSTHSEVDIKNLYNFLYWKQKQS